MKNFRRRLFFGLVLALSAFWLTLGCQRVTPPISTSPPASTAAPAATKLLVSAAVSLKDALEEIQQSYQTEKTGTTIVHNFGASGALQQQIENGAPVDIFISAAVKQMDELEKKGLLVAETRINLAANQLVLIVPIEASTVKTFSDLSNPEINRVAIGEPRSVPAGQYAEQVLRSLNLWDQVQPKLVLANNVRQVLASVESGNADAGLVYATDAKNSKKVKVVAIANEKDHKPIVYPMAVLKNSKQASIAKEFTQFLTGDRAKTVLRKYGFTVPKSA